ncbi:hypothetical protein D3C76_957360 [compost metagenome]
MPCTVQALDHTRKPIISGGHSRVGYAPAAIVLASAGRYRTGLAIPANDSVMAPG